MLSPMLPSNRQPQKLAPRQPLVFPVRLKASCIYAMLPIETGGSTIPDYSSRERHGNPVGTVWTTKGRRGPALKFNGSTGRINTNAKWAGTGAKTLIFSAWPDGWGGSNAGAFFNNGKLWIGYLLFLLSITFSSDGGVTRWSKVLAAAPDGSYQFLAFTRTAAGVVNAYQGLENQAPQLYGAANQNSGAPAAATTNVFIGNNATFALGFPGCMEAVLVFSEILTLDEITTVWQWLRR